jgi:gliding motility-associated lipoprotein GldH
MRMNKLINRGLLILAALLFVSCDQDRVFEEKADFPQNNWAINDSREFTFTIPDTTQLYDVYFTIRHDLDYEYYNLYLRHTLTGPEDQVLSSLLHEIILLDKKTGKPKGKGSGGVYDYQVRALRNQKFSRPGPYRLKVQQYMRRDPLPGIMAVGVRVEKAG